MYLDYLGHHLTLLHTVDAVGTSEERLVGAQISVLLTILNWSIGCKCSYTGFNKSLHPFSDCTECLFEPGTMWWAIFITLLALYKRIYFVIPTQIHFIGRGSPRPKFVSPRKSESWSYLNYATQISSRTWKRTCTNYSRYCDPACRNRTGMPWWNGWRGGS